MSLDRDIEKAIKKLELLGEEFTKGKRRQIARKGAAEVRKAARAETPKRTTPKGPKERTTSKGQIARYFPGNLKKSIQTIATSRTSKSADVFVGAVTSPKLGKEGGEFGKSAKRVDAYYAHMVYGSARAFRNRILVSAANKTRGPATRAMIKKAEELLKRKIASISRI